MPHTALIVGATGIVGHAIGNVMNMGSTLAVYTGLAAPGRGHRLRLDAAIEG